MPWRDMDAETLEREYSPSSMIGGDYMPYIQRYIADSAAARDQLRVAADLEYGPDPAQVLDYFPAGQPNAPLHVFIHGGYWQELSQKESASMAPAIVAGGSAFATLNYRLAPDASLTEIVADIQRALQWLVGRADALGFDKRRVTLSGHSAGAHLVAQILCQPGQALTESGLLVERAVLISGVFDLAPIALTTVNDRLGLTKAEISDLSPLALQPIWHPSIDVVVAEHDTAEFRRQSQAHAAHVQDAGLVVGFRQMGGLNHFDIILDGDVFGSMS